MTLFIDHSGVHWISGGRGPNGYAVWPIDEYLVRRRHRPEVAARIRRLNPNGKEEGSRPRGWHPHARSRRYDLDLVSVDQFIKRFGRAKYRSLPREAFYRDGHRKGIKFQYAMECR
jgi:hypothetical protein